MIIPNILRKLSDLQERYAILFVLVVLTISSFFLYYGLRVETDSDFDVMFRDDSQAMILKRLIDAEFGGTDTLFILAKVNQDTNDKTRVQDIRHPDVIAGFRDLSISLKSETFTASVWSLADILEMVYGRLPTSLEESKWMIDNLPEDIKEDFLGMFLSKDFNFQNMAPLRGALLPSGADLIYFEIILKGNPLPIQRSADAFGLNARESVF